VDERIAFDSFALTRFQTVMADSAARLRAGAQTLGDATPSARAFGDSADSRAAGGAYADAHDQLARSVTALGAAMDAHAERVRRASALYATAEDEGIAALSPRPLA
jgi:uncharacterized protein YukE